MSINFLIGILGAIILVIGAALPDTRISHPVKSFKNWFFVIGSLFMLVYSILNYFDGGSIFFVILQIYINSSSIFMMTNTSDKIDVPVMLLFGFILIIWSLFLFEDYSTILFILGLTTLGTGFVLRIHTCKREIMLTIGSAIISLFSYLQGDMIFFLLNLFFALFSEYHSYKICHIGDKMKRWIY